jgi:YidC/Oxa1 family membrane protein insertase
MGSQRQKIMTGMAFFLGLVTAFQPAGLQLYFLVSGILGAGTGWLLRQNGFRRLIRIRPIPSKESTELYTQVVKGTIKLKDVKGKDGKVRYQAPTTPTSTGPTRPARRTLSGISLKTGTPVPAHFKVAPLTQIDSENPDREADFEEGAKGTMMEKLDYYRRNYRLSFMAKRMRAVVEGFADRYFGQGGKKLTEAQRRRKQSADRYEIERKRRFENRQ